MKVLGLIQVLRLQVFSNQCSHAQATGNSSTLGIAWPPNNRFSLAGELEIKYDAPSVGVVKDDKTVLIKYSFVTRPNE
jgi:hypothetical protein